MDGNINNLVDYALENSNQRDVTLINISPTESMADDPTLKHLDQNLSSINNPLEGLISENSSGNFVKTRKTSTESSNDPIDYQSQSMKDADDKQGQSENNVVLDSPSLSSESWLTFHPNLCDRGICEYFSKNEQTVLMKDNTNHLASSSSVTATENCDTVKPLKRNTAWIFDLSTSLTSEYKKMPAIKKPVTSEVTSPSGNRIRSGGSVGSHSDKKTSDKNFVDLTSLPDPPQHCKKASHKTNISWYIDLGKKTPLKKMPTRLSLPNLSHKKVNTSKIEINTAKEEKLQDVSLRSKSDDSDSLVTYIKLGELCNDPNTSLSSVIGIPKFESTPSYRSSINKINNTIPEIEESPDSEKKVEVEETNEPTGNFDNPKKPAVVITVTSATPEKDNEPESAAHTARSMPKENCGGSITSKSCCSELEITLKRLFPDLSTYIIESLPRAAIQVEQENLTLNETPAKYAIHCNCKSDTGADNDTPLDFAIAKCLKFRCESTLSQDFLDMFLKGIKTDVTVLVSGKRIKAHQCVLTSRSEYFARNLSCQSGESSEYVIALPSCSVNVGLYALCHIYTGMSEIPDWVCIVELLQVADLLGIESLKEATASTLKSKYCHNFHEPCSECITGVLDCFIMCWVHGLDDLFYKCMTWVTTHFTKIWPTKRFATLPNQLLDKCYSDHCYQFTADTFVQWIYDVAMTLDALPNSRWAENVQLFGKRLLDAASTFASGQLFEIFKKILFTSADAPPPAKRAFEDCITSAIDTTTAEQACLAYVRLHYEITQVPSNVQYKRILNQNIFLVTHANHWLEKCEQVILKSEYIATAPHFKNLPLPIRKKIKRERNPAPSEQKNNKRKSSVNSTFNLNMDQMRSVFVPCAPKPTANTGSEIQSKEINNLKKRKANPPFVRMTIAQEKRAQYNLKKRIESLENGNKKRTQTRRPLHHHPKSGQPEPNVNKDTNTDQKKFENEVVSISSESSLNTSPTQKTNNRSSRSKSKDVRTQAMAQDSPRTSSRPRTAESGIESQASSNNRYEPYVEPDQRQSRAASPTGPADSVAQAAGRVTKAMIPAQQSQMCNAKKQRVTDELASKPSVTAAQGERERERKPHSTLMNATKASRAKAVGKIIKGSKGIIPKQPVRRAPPAPTAPPAPLALPRSGTLCDDNPQPSCSGIARAADRGRD